MLSTIRTHLFTLLFFLFIGFCSKAQKIEYLDKPVSLNVKELSFKEVINIISSQTSTVFSYSQEFDAEREVTYVCKR